MDLAAATHGNEQAPPAGEVRGRVAWAAVRLGDLAHGRDNNFQLIRFLAATAVIVFHSFALTNRFTDEPLWKIAPELNFGALGVKSFFVVSGFLVTQSWLARKQLLSFAAARALRIYPGLVLATLFSIALAARSSEVPLADFLTNPQTLGYAWRNMLGYEAWDQLPGAYAHNPFPNSVNGSLWTLPLELRLYVALGIFGLLGVLARRWLWAAAVAALIALVAVVPEWYPLVLNSEGPRRFALCFAIGSLAYAWRDAIPMSLPGMVVAIALIAINPFGLGRGLLFEPLLAYSILSLAYHPLLQWPAFNRPGDYSYGLYIYSYPLQQTIAQIMPRVDPWGLFALALPLALCVAALSWHLVEKPALGLKSRFRSPTPTSRK